MQMDKINPKHYKDNVIETIDAIESQLSDKEFVGYLKGSVLKYMCRSGKKVGVSSQEDYQKAEWYLQRLIDRKDKLPMDLHSKILQDSPSKFFDV